MKILIQNGRVIDPASGFDQKADVAIAEGRVLAVGAAPAGFKPQRVIDAAGNLGSVSNSLSFAVNTSSVSQTVAILKILDNVDPLQGNVANGATSNDTTPTLSGSISTALSAGDVVEVLRDGSVIGTASVSATTWTYQDSGLVDGQSYSYTARVVIAIDPNRVEAIDDAGRTEPGVPLQLVVVGNDRSHGDEQCTGGRAQPREHQGRQRHQQL